MTLLQRLFLLLRILGRAGRASTGASLLETAVSLVILGTGTGGLVGAIALGAVAGNFIEEQDASLTAARSELEFVASSPVAATYDVFPSAPQGLVVEVALTGDETTGCLGRQHLQCVGIVVSRAPKATGDDPIPIASLVTFKAKRFLDVNPVNPSDPLKVVPKAGGTTRQKDFPVPDLPPRRGFAIVISEVFATTSPSDILVQWHPTLDTSDRLKTVAVYRGRPFGAQTEDLTCAPEDVAAPLQALGQNKESPLLSVAATAVATGDYTVYLFNESQSDTLLSLEVEASCVCSVEP